MPLRWRSSSGADVATELDCDDITGPEYRGVVRRLVMLLLAALPLAFVVALLMASYTEDRPGDTKPWPDAAGWKDEGRWAAIGKFPEMGSGAYVILEKVSGGCQSGREGVFYYGYANDLVRHFCWRFTDKNDVQARYDDGAIVTFDLLRFRVLHNVKGAPIARGS